MSATELINFGPLRSVAFGSITGSYAVLGAVFGHVTRIVKIVNTCDTDMLISFDGTTDNDIVPAGSFVLYDGAANKYGNATKFVWRINTQVYVKYASAPSSGTIYCTNVYAKGE